MSFSHNDSMDNLFDDLLNPYEYRQQYEKQTTNHDEDEDEDEIFESNESKQEQFNQFIKTVKDKSYKVNPMNKLGDLVFA